MCSEGKRAPNEQAVCYGSAWKGQRRPKLGLGWVVSACSHWWLSWGWWVLTLPLMGAVCALPWLCLCSMAALDLSSPFPCSFCSAVCSARLLTVACAMCPGLEQSHSLHLAFPSPSWCPLPLGGFPREAASLRCV